MANVLYHIGCSNLHIQGQIPVIHVIQEFFNIQIHRETGVVIFRDPFLYPLVKGMVIKSPGRQLIEDIQFICRGVSSLFLVKVTTKDTPNQRAMQTRQPAAIAAARCVAVCICLPSLRVQLFPAGRRGVGSGLFCRCGAKECLLSCLCVQGRFFCLCRKTGPAGLCFFKVASEP